MTDKGTYDSRDKKVKISVLCLVVDKKKNLVVDVDICY